MAFIYSHRLLSFSIKNHLAKKLFSQNVDKCHYDIIIAGGGMVGTTLACALGKKPQLRHKKILLLEGSKEIKWSPIKKYSNRVVAITPATQKLLNTIGAWDLISRNRFGSVKKMQIWDGYSDAMITFNNDDMSDQIAYIVENNLLLAAVNNVVKGIDNVTVINEAKIKDYKLPNPSENIVEVIMDDESKFSCSLLLGADGAKSKVREKMGCQYLNWDYNQMGVVATLKFTEPGDNVVAWQRFISNGPIALLPLDDCHSSLVWTTSTERAKELLKMSEECFVDELNNGLWKSFEKNSLVENFTKRVNSFLENLNLPSNAVRQLPPNIASIEPGSRAAFPLGFGHSTNYVSRGVALVGDAAHRVHPLAGQGVNLGFGDVSCIADLLAQAVSIGRNIGSMIHLRQYQSQRQMYNVPTMLAIDGIQKLYNTELTPIVLLRSLGLQVTHAMKPIKKMIIEHASG